MDDHDWSQYYCGPDEFAEQITSGIVTFGGNVGMNSFLRANGNTASVVNSQLGALDNVTIVSVMSRPYAVTWNTAAGTATTRLQLLVDDAPAYDLDFTVEGPSGVRRILMPIALQQGSTLQVRHVGGTPPGPSVVSFYLTPV
jgi:hypothetical protein